jgi:hypothetical protein
MRLTRRQALAGAAASALGAAGIYELVDRLAGGAGTEQVRRSVGRMVNVVVDNDVEVVVPPRHHRLVTAKVAGSDPRQAARELEDALRELENRFDPTTPAGLGVTIGWGVPYFRNHVAEQTGVHLPHDRRAGKPALIDSIRFPSDPAETILEDNDVAVLLRADARDHIVAGAKALFADLDVFRVTSIREGFVGGGLPKRMAVAAGVPGADLIPAGAQLFLGFTSTQKDGLGPSRIANLETLGYVDLGPKAYFRGGTHMHVSHLFEDLEAWYLNFDFRERVDTAFRPGLHVKPGTQTVSQGPHDVDHASQVERNFRDQGASVTAPRSRRRRGCSATSSPTTVSSTGGGRRFPSVRTSTRSTIRSRGARIRRGMALPTARVQASTSSSSTRRATTSTGTGSRWTAVCRTGRDCPCDLVRAARGSTPC